MSNEMTFVVKVTVDADKYAAEYGERRPVADILGEMRGWVHAALNPTPLDWYTYKVDDVTDPMQAMGEQTRKDLLSAFDSWAADRDVLGHREEEDFFGGVVDYSDSDDTAVDLLRQIAAALRTTDECGHGDSDVDGDTVTCAWCGQTWDVADPEPDEDGPEKMTDTPRPDHWQGYATEESFRFSVIWNNDQDIYSEVKRYGSEWLQHPDHDNDDHEGLGQAVVAHCKGLRGFESLNGFNWDLIDPQEVGGEVVEVLEV